jgi:hypothetical protein
MDDMAPVAVDPVADAGATPASPSVTTSASAVPILFTVANSLLVNLELLSTGRYGSAL